MQKRVSFTTKEVAAFCGTTETRLVGLCHEGKFTPQYFGNGDRVWDLRKFHAAREFFHNENRQKESLIPESTISWIQTKNAPNLGVKK
jgi:hypothetical protein